MTTFKQIKEINITSVMDEKTVTDHNQSLLDTLTVGDLIEFDRIYYKHWAVYAGNNKVFHLTGNQGPIVFNRTLAFSLCDVPYDGCSVKQDEFWDIVGDSKAWINNSKDRKYRYRL
ncbi:phospholipase A and acyltransferase 3-like [Mytilus californianus]|uniref:phospholipase A and acyltransferase 3-like n=1 Tax=Mytilus californianus TaxID=6549 RepID=UPI002246DFA5|nr:phospholipase A and acyltransferase 3-like [Mytilus californianus]